MSVLLSGVRFVFALVRHHRFFERRVKRHFMGNCDPVLITRKLQQGDLVHAGCTCIDTDALMRVDAVQILIRDGRINALAKIVRCMTMYNDQLACLVSATLMIEELIADPGPVVPHLGWHVPALIKEGLHINMRANAAVNE